jgi:hypothetical protein
MTDGQIDNDRAAGRSRIFTSLSIDKLDRVSIKRRVDHIGRLGISQEVP